MQIRSVRVQHFRSIEDETLVLADLTALIGANGTGKSSFLRALAYFYEGAGGASPEDFYNRDTERPIEISVTYADLPQELAGLCERFVRDESLEVTLRISAAGPDGAIRSAHHGRVGAHAPFQRIRRSGEGAMAKRQALAALATGEPEKYSFAARFSSLDEAERAMDEWEAANPADLALEEDDGSFFRAPNSGGGPLAPFTQLILVPAVRDAAGEASSGRATTIGRLVALAVGDIATSESVRQLTTRFNEEYLTEVDRQQRERLPRLETSLNAALREYVPDASVTLHWAGAAVSVSQPRTSARLDDGFLGDVEGKGHGLQRLFLVSLLQAAAAVQSESRAQGQEAAGAPADGRGVPKVHYLLAIEEPELYQHPLQARRLAATLDSLAATRPDAPAETQVLYCSHSPFFVGVDHFDRVRLARKVPNGHGLPLATRLSRVDPQAAMMRIEKARDVQEGTYTIPRFMSQLATVMTVMVNEGLFAKNVVLVEGIEDQAYVLAALQAAGLNADAYGLAIVPVNGKTNLDRPYVIFTELGISTFVIFDADMHKTEQERHHEVNTALLTIVNVPHPQDFNATIIRKEVAMFNRTLQGRVRDEFGTGEFDRACSAVASDMGWDVEIGRALKSPVFVGRVFHGLAADGRRAESLDRIVEVIRDHYLR